jgi:hypothetical protein
MRRYAFLPLLLVLFLATPTSLSDQAGDLGQATITIHATISGHSHYTDAQGCHWDDEVTVTVTESDKYCIADLIDGSMGLQMMSHQNNYSVSGGGKQAGEKCGGQNTWTYKIKDHTDSGAGGVWVNLGTGRGGFTVGNLLQSADLKSVEVGEVARPRV